MKGLLLKDWYMTLRHYRFVFPISAVFILLAVFSENASFMFTVYPCLLLAMIPYSSYAYDERDHWLSYLGALPVSRGQYVSAKYVTALIAVAGMVLVDAAAELVHGLTSGVFSWATLPYMAAGGCMSLLMPALLMPLVLRFGAEKGRLVYYMLIGGMAVAMITLLGGSSETMTGFGYGPVLPILMGVVAFVFAASWVLSAALFRRRDLP